MPGPSDAVREYLRSNDKNQNDNDKFLSDVHAKLLDGTYTSGADKSEDVPTNSLVKFGMVTLDGAANLVPGMWNAAVHDVTHPWETAKMLGTSAAIGAGMRLLLPEDVAGKAIAGAIGTYMLVKGSMPIVHAYEKGMLANTMTDLHAAGKELGNAGGAFVVDTAASGVAAGLASKATGRALISERMDGFAEAKYKFWNGVENKWSSVFGDGPAEAPVGPLGSAPQFRIEGDRATLLDSHRAKPDGTLKGEVDPNTPMDVSLYLKSKASDYKIARTIARQDAGLADYITDDAQFEKKFGADPKAVAQIQKFAADNGLKLSEMDTRSGRVVLQGTAARFSDAFGTKLGQYENNGGTFRGREGSLSVPKELAPHLEGIFGLDTRPQAKTHYVKFADSTLEPAKGGSHAGDHAAAKPKPMMPTEVADLYNFPKGTTGSGQGVAVIELGGGIDLANEADYYKAHGLPMPKINVIEINGAKNSPGDPQGADGEVALDSQVIGSVAPKATQNVIFAPNSDRGFMDAVTRGTFAEKGEVPNQAISISWGGPEEAWTQQAARGMTMAFQKARLKGIGTYAASGDDGATDRSQSNSFQADYPSSDPNVTGTGGTRLIGSDGKIKSETAWNNGEGRGAGGGGISQLWDVPDYQKGLEMPPNANNTGKPGRGVPDVAGNADPRSGYIIRVGGQEGAIGGTSAVAPLYAALHVRLTEGVGKPIGNLNPFFYKNGETRGVFNDITAGNNNGYETKPGWDPVTGWGSINGTKLLDALKADSANRAKVFRLWPTPVASDPAAQLKVGG